MNYIEKKKKIKELREQGFSYQKIADIFGVSRQRIHQISTSYKSPMALKELERIKEMGERVRIGVVKIKEAVFIKIPKGNITYLTGLRGDTRNRYRELIRIRDNHTCQICGKVWEKGERRLDVHHLDEDPIKTRKTDNLLLEADNMVTFCHKCHLNLPGHRESMRLENRNLSTAH